TPVEKAAKRQKLDEEVEELKRHLQIMPNEDDDVYTEATPLSRKDRFSTTKPKNFSDDFLLVTLGAMFEKQNIHAQIWKNQRSVHGLAKVKGWKLLDSRGVQIITFTTTQMILFVERKYILTRFTLDQMLNAVRLEVKEEAESQIEIYKIDLDHANKVLSMQEDESEPTEVQEVVEVVTTAKLITEVVTAVSETIMLLV
nr:hypothetical protein [Tanacetum cinerariifolium]